MKKSSNYKDLIVWQKSKKLAVDVYQTTNLFPQNEIYSLTNQIRRSSVSIPSNIAEGFQRNSQKEFIQFLYHAYGSCAELETQLMISFEVDYLEKSKFNELTNLLLEIQKMLNSLINKCKLNLKSDI